MSGATTPGPKNQLKNLLVTQDQTTQLHPGSLATPTGTGASGTAGALAAAASGPSIQIIPLGVGTPLLDSGVFSMPEIYLLNAASVFSITAEPRMPVIQVSARIIGISFFYADPTPNTDFHWTASVSFDSAKCLNGIKTITTKKKDGTPTTTKTTTKIPALTVTRKSRGGLIVIDFNESKEIRGGDLKITVTATVGGQLLTGETKGWRIQGTNPSKAAVSNAMRDDTCRKMACLESGMKQFIQAPDDGNVWYPYFSNDQLLGVGIFQLTDPAPTPDQIWDWTKNVEGGVALYDGNKRQAKRYPGDVAKSAKFLGLVKKYNDSLKAQSLAALQPGGAAATLSATTPGQTAPQPPAAAPVTVTVPEFTAEQLEDDTIRRFNGWAGDDGFTGHLHEFRIKVDKATGNLVVTGDPKTLKVAAQWERVPVAERPGRGDPSYVDHVKNLDPKTCAKLK